MKNADRCAYPNEHLLAPGLTKRELIAAMAMQGIMSNPELCDLNKTRIAQESCILADALLKALEE